MCGRISGAVFIVLSALALVDPGTAMAQTANRSPTNAGGGESQSPDVVNRSPPSTGAPRVCAPVGNGNTPEDKTLEHQDTKATEICKGC